MSAERRSHPFKPLLWSLAAVIVAILASTMIVRAYKRPGQMTVLAGMNMDMSSMASAPGMTPVAVETMRRTLFEAKVTYTGTILPFNEQSVFPRVDGYLRDFSVYAGDSVRAGQLLARLEAPDLSRKAAEAQYGSAAAQQDVAVSEAEVTRLERERQTAVAELSAAQSERSATRGQQRAAERAVQEARDMIQVKQAALQQAQQQVTTAQASQREAEKGVASAQASVTYWEAEQRRIQRLLSLGAASVQEAQSEQSQHDAAVAALAQAQAKVDEARATVGAARASVAQMRADAAAAQSRLEQAIAAVETAVATVANRDAMAQAARLKIEAAQAMVDKSRREVSQRQSMARQSQAQLATARTFESFRDVTAPFSGKVTRRLVSPGTLVGPSTAIMTIAQLDRVRLQANVAEADLANIQVGAPVRATLNGNEGTSIDSRVTSVFPQADPTSRTAIVEAVVPNPGYRLIPGKYVVMEISTSSRREQFTIQNRAVVRRSDEAGVAGQTYVWLAVPGKDRMLVAWLRPVSLGPTDGQRTVVTSGLKPGDQVIYAGHDSLKEGDMVTPSPWTKTDPKELPQPMPAQGRPGMPGMENMPGMGQSTQSQARSGHRHSADHGMGDMPGMPGMKMGGPTGKTGFQHPAHPSMPGMPGM